MHYVVLEVELALREDSPKDWAQISRFDYQFVDAKTLKPVFEENRQVKLGAGCSLQDAVSQLDHDIVEHITDDFVLCSLYSTWHFRVTIPRQARDEVFILPPHLQHPKVFDLWKEYQRWCVNHPETLALRKTTAATKKNKDLEELKSVLELNTTEDDNSADGQTEVAQKPFNLVDETVAVIIRLHKKCDTPEDKVSVLTHPYDSYLDVRNFLQERSKVLYMNNLPPDTTQSELESWFTQFGARPVGFWTVRNIVEETSNVNNNWSSNNSTYVEAEDSISGFVVFQSHEEATEALSLNGRSILSNIANTKQPRVIEHTVEIQPSSSRVLDRAQEILSPFPQSKNKPRPGDWNCPSCGFSNFQRRTSCFRCSFPATSAAAINKTSYMKNGLQSHPAQGLNDQQTTYKIGNGPSSMSTVSGPVNGNLMQQNAQSHQQHLQQQHPHQQHHHQQQQQRARYTPGQRFGQNQQQGGSNVPFRAGDWKCAVCTYHNFAKNVVCLRCGGPKTTEHQQKDLGSVNSYTNIQEIGNGMGVSLNTRSFSEPAW
ncbi:LANO_0E01200g1_1 [Lachancea nothofagi CBS 11611]|uniref:LANO_0E01200g1_1 n=1 Tax=Lachancea nothofagi CBS 11611 TaxID=1266666 RepID=A0A1G4JPK8_9SACH|nr:LANO_0E01200g1_1 [Lachancea nothofagi CBS 11611]